MQNDPSLAWDAHASTYDALFAELTGTIARAMLRLVAHRLPPAASVLDVACGTGAFALPALQRALTERANTGAAGSVTASDFSRAMLSITEARGRAMGGDDAVFRAEVQNGEALSYPDATFDLVASCFGIFLFNDRRAGWREAARVLKPGGLFVTAVWQGPQSNPMLREQMAPVGRALPARLQGPPPQGAWLEVSERAALVREIEETGAFAAAQAVEFHCSIAFGQWPRLWDAMKDNPVMGALLARCTADELEAVRESLFAHLGGLAGGDDAPLTLESVCNIVIATRR
jgi:ubiquinone/menaquinone biosynthesis C-methylase UbiE